MRLRRRWAWGALCGIVACSGGGGSSTPPQQGRFASGKLVLAIPAKAATSRAHQRLFLSPSAASVSIAVGGVAQPFVADVSATSANCTTGLGTRTCAIAISAPIGDDTFVATLYAGADATGKVLGTGTTVAQIASGTPFSLTIGVDGSVASIDLVAARKQFTQGLAASTTISVTALDAGNNAIQGSYASPITLTNSDTTGTFTISPLTIASSTTVVTLSYSGGAGATTATISANAANVPLSSVSAQIVVVGPAPTPTPPPAPSNIYAAQIGGNSLTVTPETANGNAAPIRSLIGANTQLDQPYDVGIDANGLTYLSALRTAAVTVYAKGASGNVAPIRTIAGSNTGLDGPLGVGFDPAGDLVVANFGAASITVFAPGANGNATPVRTISGSNTGIAEAYGLTLDAAGTIYLVNNQSQFGGTDSITVYAPGANGNVAPIRTITGGATGLDGAVYDALDASGDLYVTNGFAESVTVFAPGANGNAAPKATIVGANTGIAGPAGVAVDAAGYIYVANEGGTPSITVYPPGANGNVSPIRTITGASTGLNGPGGIKIAP